STARWRWRSTARRSACAPATACATCSPARPGSTPPARAARATSSPSCIRERAMNAIAFPLEAWRPAPSDAAAFGGDLDALADVLRAVVYDGAGVSFVVPFSMDDARAFWIERVLPGVGAGTRHVLVARRDGRIVGTVQIDCATPPNQTHR